MSRAFTLIEILVAVGIMIFLLGLTLTYSGRGGDQIIIFRERARIMQELARARSLSASLFREGDEKICGYGLHVRNSSILILFKDLSSSSEKCVSNKLYDGGGEKVDEYTLDPKAELIDFTGTDTFFFLPPKPDIYFGSGSTAQKAGSNPNNAEASISVKLKDDTQVLKVSVNQLGQISSE